MELHGHVACVITDPEPPIDDLERLCLAVSSRLNKMGHATHAELLIEEFDQFADRLNVAHRFGFETEMERLPLRLGNFGKRRRRLGQALHHEVDLPRFRNPRLKRSRQRADATFATGRKQLRQNFRAPNRVFEPFVGRPVGREDLFLDARSVKLAEWKSVDRKDIETVAIQEVFKLIHRARLDQISRRRIGNSQADPKRTVPPQGLSYLHRIGLEIGAGLRP